MHTLSPGNESENPRFHLKDIPKVQGVIRPSSFKEKACGFESPCSKNPQQGSPCSIHFPRQLITTLMAEAVLLGVPSVASTWEGSTDNIHGVTTMGLQASFVYYMNKWVLLFAIIFHAAYPISSCSFSPQYASLPQSTHHLLRLVSWSLMENSTEDL